MKRNSIILFFTLGILLNVGASAQQEYDPQGTTVKKEKDGCTYHIINQIGIDSCTDEQFETIQGALQGCFDKECAIPCPDGKGKGCKILARAVVRKWAALSEADRAKFHHIKLISADAKYSSSELTAPNAGASGQANWRYPEYDNKVYCHEVLHLSGLEDKYYDCTIMNDSAHHGRYMSYGHRCEPPPDPNGGLCCDVSQAEGRRHTYPCEGHDKDIMSKVVGNDVSCINYLGIIAAAGITCADECCKTENNTNIGTTIAAAKIGLWAAFEIGVGVFKEKITGAVIRNIGPAVSIAAGVDKKINETVTVAGGIKLAYDKLSARHTRSEAPAPNYTEEISERFYYKYAALYLDMYVHYRVMQQYMLIFGPQVGVFIAARNRYTALYTTTYLNSVLYTQQYGNDYYSKITKRNVQLALNIGFGRNITIKGLSLTPYLLYSQPITNVAHRSARNALTQIMLGMMWHFR